MASISAKGGGDAKKVVATNTKTILSPSNNNTEKTSQKSTILKSPPTKIISKAVSPAQKISDPGKTNGCLSLKKMDSGSPPKVPRSPAKSITPPNKVIKSSQVKPSLNRSNSQGDGISTQTTKIEVIGFIQSAENFDVLHDIDTDSKAKAEAFDSMSGKKETNSECVTIDRSIKQNSDISEILQSIDASTNVCIKQEQILTAEQNLASGDKAIIIEKSEQEKLAEETLLFKSEEVTENSNNVFFSEISVEIIKKTESEDSVNEEPFKTIDVKMELLNKNNDATKSETNTSNELSNEKTIENFKEVESLSSPKDSVDGNTTDCTECSAETAKLMPDLEVTKQSLRLDTWKHLDLNDLVMFPRPCKGRIPNFKGAPAAAEKLAALDVFKNSKTIKINPDKPQEMVRYHTLEYGKRLLVPIPRLREGLFQSVVPPAEASKYQLQQASQRYGMKKWSRPVSSDDKISIDLIVLGSVVVDRKGHRIGKGEGFADLEFAMLVKMNAVNENTVIVTTVHDDQVHNELPEFLFEKHDVPVDWIVTPTQVYEVENKLPRPKGIIWEILSNRRILEIPILQKLRQQELSEGKECVLKEIDSDVEEKSYVPRFTRRRRFNNYSRSTGDPLRDSKLQPPSQYYPRQQRFFPSQQNRVNKFDAVRRNNVKPPSKRIHYQEEYDIRQPSTNRQIREPRGRSINQNGFKGSVMNRPHSVNRAESVNRSRSMVRSKSVTNSQNGPRYSSNRRQSDNRMPLNNNNALTKSVEVQTVDKKTRPNRQRPAFEFSLRVKNIGMGVRVRDLKIALNERGVKPRDITWRGYKGFAFLHFVKPTSKENTKSFTAEDILRTLQGLPLPPKEKKTLVIEPLKPKKAGGNQSDVTLETMNTTTISATI